jgi:hypothetical protein
MEESTVAVEECETRSFNAPTRPEQADHKKVEVRLVAVGGVLLDAKATAKCRCVSDPSLGIEEVEKELYFTGSSSKQ